jgi:hypothetical protein
MLRVTLGRICFRPYVAPKSFSSIVRDLMYRFLSVNAAMGLFLLSTDFYQDVVSLVCHFVVYTHSFVMRDSDTFYFCRKARSRLQITFVIA